METFALHSRSWFQAWPSLVLDSNFGLPLVKVKSTKEVIWYDHISVNTSNLFSPKLENSCKNRICTGKCLQ